MPHPRDFPRHRERELTLHYMMMGLKPADVAMKVADFITGHKAHVAAAARFRCPPPLCAAADSDAAARASAANAASDALRAELVAVRAAAAARATEEAMFEAAEAKRRIEMEKKSHAEAIFEARVKARMAELRS